MNEINNTSQKVSENASNRGLVITTKAEIILNRMSKWTKFIGIIGLIEVGFIALIGIFLFFIPLPQAGNHFSSGFIGIFYLIYALILFFPPYFLVQYSAKMKKAIANLSQNDFDRALSKLENFFTYIGILILVTLIFMFIGLFSFVTLFSLKSF